MPTPFTHLFAAQRLLADDTIGAGLRDNLRAHLPAFLLGSIAADGHIGKIKREETHFYTYDAPITTPPWQVMLAQYPILNTPQDADHHAFLAGYTVHLAMDAVWATEMLRAQFVEREWGSRGLRFLVLHVMLTRMDERDYALFDPEVVSHLAEAQPHSWLPFLPDEALLRWRDIIIRQLPPDGNSETLNVLGGRVGKTPDELRKLVDSDGFFEARVWANIPQAMLATVETRMAVEAREALIAYMQSETVSPAPE